MRMQSVWAHVYNVKHNAAYDIESLLTGVFDGLHVAA